MSKKKGCKKKAAKVRILIVDDHPIVREGVKRLLERQADMEVCGEAESAPEALRVIESAKPDVAIVDIVLKESSGLDLIKDIRHYHPEVKVLALSMRDPNVYAERAIRAGARAYLRKERGARTVVEAVRRVLAGEVYLDAAISQRILARLAGISTEAGEKSVSSLTDRELEILRLIGQGLSTREIAGKLHRSVKTVETHRENMKEKLKLDTARDLLQYAIEWSKSPPA